MKKKTQFIIVIIILILATLIALNFQDNKKQDNKKQIKIGVIAPLSGSPSLWGQGSLNMMEIAVDEINSQGGVNDRMLSLIAEDGKCKSESAVASLKKLIKQDGVKFVLGGHCSPETAAMAPVIEENKVFGLAGVSTASGILDDYSYAFRTSPSNFKQAKLIAQLAYDKYEIKNIAIITEQTAFAKSISLDFIKAFKEKGGNVLISEEVLSDQRDFRTELLKIKSNNPDAIFVSPQSPAVGIEIIKQINQLKIDTKITGNTVFISRKVNEESGNLLPINAFTVAPYVDSKKEKAKILFDKYKNKYGKEVPYNNFFVGAAYDGVYMLSEAINVCGEDSTCVRNYFSDIEEYQGVVSNFSFTDSGDPEINNWVELNIVNGQENVQIIKD